MDYLDPQGADYDEACTSASEFDELDIMQAVQFGDLSKVKHLVESGLASVNDADSDDCSLLHWAAINNRLQVAKYLIDNNCQVNRIGGVLGCTPLHWATRQGHTRMVALLVKHGADYNIVDGEGFSVLHTACQYSRTPIACYLVAKGQNPDARDGSQMTPLMYAASRSTQRDPMHMLVSMGADVNAVDNVFGHTPLHFAVLHGNHSAISNLLKLNPDLTILNKQNETALDVAQRKNDFLSIRLLEMAERQAALRRFSWKQKIYEDQSFRSQIAYLMPFIFYLVPGFLFNAKMDLFLKVFLLFVTYGFCGSVLKYLISNHVPTVNAFALGTVISSKLFYFVIWLVFLHQTAGWYFQICFFGILVSLPYLFWVLYNRDPGVITASHAEKCRQVVEMSEGDNFSGNFCSTCLIIRPLRSKHCRYCDKCVKRFDHHCLWLNKCIGQYNHRLFVGYLSMLYGSVLLEIVGCLKYLNGVCGEVSFETFINCNPWVAFALVMAANLLVWLTVVNYMQFISIARAMTSNERLNASRYRHFGVNGNQNPWSRGCLWNLYDFFFEEDLETKAPVKVPIV